MGTPPHPLQSLRLILADREFPRTPWSEVFRLVYPCSCHTDVQQSSRWPRCYSATWPGGFMWGATTIVASASLSSMAARGLISTSWATKTPTTVRTVTAKSRWHRPTDRRATLPLTHRKRPRIRRTIRTAVRFAKASGTTGPKSVLPEFLWRRSRPDRRRGTFFRPTTGRRTFFGADFLLADRHRFDD